MSNSTCTGSPDRQSLYDQACRHAEAGRYSEAEHLYAQLAVMAGDLPFRALIANDRATLATCNGDRDKARQGFAEALTIHPQCAAARSNLALLERPALPVDSLSEPAGRHGLLATTAPDGAVKVAVVSFLFNWPSTGGGIIHTVELVKFLAQAGYQVRHFFVRYRPWAIGVVRAELPIPSEALDFNDASWNVHRIRERVRRAVDAFHPDYAIITDAWNMKPHLAAALRGYPTYLRFQALECVCPLNNVRLLTEAPEQFRQCSLNQLATPADCRQCLQRRGTHSGSLHQAERELAGVGTVDYPETLVRALRDAEAALVLNPATAELLKPYTRQVLVVPWGMDPARFPWPVPEPPSQERLTIFQAGVIDEPMKGFHVLHAACERLWQKRQDFELVATGEPAGPVDAFTRFTSWVNQDELPRYYQAADIVVVPTVAQEGLSRTSVEAMASGRPVVASRIGGLPSTVGDGETGLLFEPGNAAALAAQLERLLDDPGLRQRLGAAGRRVFEDQFAWPRVVERHYRPLLILPTVRQE